MKNNEQNRPGCKVGILTQKPSKKIYRKPALKRLGLLRSVAASKVTSDGGCYIRW